MDNQFSNESLIIIKECIDNHNNFENISFYGKDLDLEILEDIDIILQSN